MGGNEDVGSQKEELYMGPMPQSYGHPGCDSMVGGVGCSSLRPGECISCLNLQKSLLYYRKRFTHLFYFFSQKQLQELARQRDMYVQLLLQNMMLSKDRQLKQKNYWLLFTFAGCRDRVLMQYPMLPKYTVPFVKHPVSDSLTSSGFRHPHELLPPTQHLPVATA
jgi:hypothetical protein